MMKAPIHPGDAFCAASGAGHVRQPRSGEPATRWRGPGLKGAGPGDEPLTIDLDSTVCETVRTGFKTEKRPSNMVYISASGAITRC